MPGRPRNSTAENLRGQDPGSALAGSLRFAEKVGSRAKTLAAVAVWVGSSMILTALLRRPPAEGLGRQRRLRAGLLDGRRQYERGSVRSALRRVLSAL